MTFKYKVEAAGRTVSDEPDYCVAFESFLGCHTWRTRHLSDRRRFHAALASVIFHGSFRAQDLEEDIREWFKVPPSDQDSFTAQTISQYCRDAEVVWEFVRTNGMILDAGE